MSARPEALTRIWRTFNIAKLYFSMRRPDPPQALDKRADEPPGIEAAHDALQTMIPKILHQTNWNKELPAEVVENTDRLRASNPGWEYRFYDDKECFEFIRKNYDMRVQRAYNKINPRYGAARADFFRYLLVYRCGGLYLDIKSGASKSFDEIVGNHEYLLSHWDNGPDGTHPGWGMHFKNFEVGEFQQWHIASVAGHPFLRGVIDLVVNNIENYSVERFGKGFEGSISTTGPVPYTLAIAPLMKSASYHLEQTNHQLGFVFNALNVEYRQLMYNKNKQHYSQQTERVVL
jgi:mannosyltransferase OCH1-like enzyme